MNIWIIVLIVLSAIFLGLLLISLGFFFSCFVRKTKKEAGEEKIVGSKWKPHLHKIDIGKQWIQENKTEVINIKAKDGINLQATYIKGNSNKFIIFVHGYKGSSVSTWGCQAKYFNTKCGYNIIMPDLRAHGNSGGKFIGFGILDRYDILKWINYTVDRFGKDIEIALEGVSMGGATVLMATGFNLPSSVKCVIADCAFTSPKNVFEHVLKTSFKMPSFPIMQITNLINRIVSGYWFNEYSTFIALKTNRLPVLFIHGDSDNFVPTYMSRQNYLACTSEKKLLIVKNAHHALSYYTDTELFSSTIENFITKHFSN